MANKDNQTGTTRRLRLFASGDLVAIGGKDYVTHSGLLKIAKRNKCLGITVRPEFSLSEPSSRRWVFRAIVFPRSTSKGFVGYGDAEPSNVSPEFHGCELRIAETRAVNRALRKAYGIGQLSTTDAHQRCRTERAQACDNVGSYFSDPTARPAAPAHPLAPARSCPGQAVCA
jgi:hypothetical protein